MQNFRSVQECFDLTDELWNGQAGIYHFFCFWQLVKIFSAPAEFKSLYVTPTELSCLKNYIRSSSWSISIVTLLMGKDGVLTSLTTSKSSISSAVRCFRCDDLKYQQSALDKWNNEGFSALVLYFCHHGCLDESSKLLLILSLKKAFLRYFTTKLFI